MGVLLALVGAAAFAVMNVAIRKGVRPGDRDNGVLTTVVINVVVFSLLIAILAATRGLPTLTWPGVGAFVAAGLASTFIGRTTLFAGIRRAGAVRAAAVKNATPLITLVIALVLLGERLTPPAAVGIVLVLLGVALVVRESLERSSRDDLSTDATNPARLGLETEAFADAGSEESPPTGGTDVADGRPSRAMLVGLGLAGIAAVSFGTGHALRKVGMDILPDAALGATIGSWSALAAYTASAAVRGELGRMRSSIGAWKPYFWLAGIGGGVGQIAFFAALNFAPVAHVSVVAASETILTVAFAGLVARAEHITRQLVIPATLVCIGVAAIALSR